MRRRALFAAAAIWPTRTADAGPQHLATSSAEHAEVDLSLVLATDVSSSISEDEMVLQRQGYCAALTDPLVLRGIATGPHAAIGVAYVEWSGLTFQRLLLPWARIASAAESEAWAAALLRRPLPAASSRRGTAISRGIAFSLRVLEDTPWAATRRVIDICGDGPNNNGEPVEKARDLAVAKGVTLNGLAIEGGPRNETGIARPDTVLAYYRAAVIGGPGAFALEAAGLSDFADAMRRKLVLEVTGTERAESAEC
ncbi:DUF1194 domain-containing protein [Falsiroseomonas sp.]|uniref:DUF1194 domain-containing protein n=1 Tax=Falsiroseomonas sp. TaxID=2870721 RepID=UPI00356675C8